VGGPTVATQDVRLLSEYYVYEILALFKLPVETTRLTKITYLDANGDFVYSNNDKHEKWGFFREPPKSVAKRCNLLHKAPQGVATSSNTTSAFEAEFINIF